MTCRAMFVIALLALVAPIAGTEAFAQAFSTVSGTVVDPQGGLLPGVTMVLTNARSGAKYEIKTSRTGEFEFVGLPAGDYQLDARLPGFRTGQEAITVAGRSLIRNITLRVGELEETVTVTGGDERAARLSPASEEQRKRFQELAARCTPAAAPTDPGIGGSIKPPVKIGNAATAYAENLHLEHHSGIVSLMTWRI